MSTQAILRSLQAKADGLDNNRVSNFSYTDNALANDDVVGVENFTVNAENNIPSIDATNLSLTVRNKGMRSQASSIPREALNHFWGRTSYNLNKIVQVVKNLLQHTVRASAHNCFEYDALAKYLYNDMCYITHAVNNRNVVSTFRRKGNNPVEIQGISPLLNLTEWELVSPSDVPMLVENVNEALAQKENTANKKTHITNSDTDFPTSNAVKTQLDLKATLDNPTFTGTVRVPSKTSALTNDGTLLATEAQVKAIADDMAAAVQIGDKSITFTKIQDISADAGYMKAAFSTAITSFLGFLRVIWRGIAWLNRKFMPSSGHRHTGAEDDAPRISYTDINFSVGHLIIQFPSEPDPHTARLPGTWEKWNDRAEIYGLVRMNSYPQTSAYVETDATTVAAGAYRTVTHADGDKVIYQLINTKGSGTQFGQFNPIEWRELSDHSDANLRPIFVARNKIDGHSWSTDLEIGDMVTYDGASYRVVARHCLAGKFLSVAGGNRPPFGSGNNIGDKVRDAYGALSTYAIAIANGVAHAFSRRDGVFYGAAAVLDYLSFHGVQGTAFAHGAISHASFSLAAVVPTGRENSPRTLTVNYWRCVSNDASYDFNVGAEIGEDGSIIHHRYNVSFKISHEDAISHEQNYLTFDFTANTPFFGSGISGDATFADITNAQFFLAMQTYFLTLRDINETVTIGGASGLWGGVFINSVSFKLVDAGTMRVYLNTVNSAYTFEITALTSVLQFAVNTSTLS